LKEADIIFCLDFNNLHRINDLGSAVAESKSVKVLIDHHLEPEDFAEYQLWSTEAAATAELVYELIINSMTGSISTRGSLSACMRAL
jgi:phosphoesterase RecJ-like protein